MYTTCIKIPLEDWLICFFVENFYNHFYFLDFNAQLQVKIMYKFGGGETLMGRNLVTFRLMEEAPFQPGCNGKPCVPKIFKANQITWFFWNGQHQNQHHYWNLLNRFWLLITFGVLPKCPLKSSLKCPLKLSFLKSKI